MSSLASRIAAARASAAPAPSSAPASSIPAPVPAIVPQQPQPIQQPLRPSAPIPPTVVPTIITQPEKPKPMQQVVEEQEDEDEDEDDDEQPNGVAAQSAAHAVDDEEEEEEEEEEPPLKYQRLGSSILHILRDDAASCMAVHDKYLALGTHHGSLYILDLSGNEIRQYSNHAAAINDISIDLAGEYIGTCSNDGRIVIQGLYNNDKIEYSYNRPLKSLALDPEFHKKSTTRPLVCGGLEGKLIMNTRGWLGYKDTVMHSGEGTIYSVRWFGPYVAWANDLGVKIFDTVAGQRITFIDRPATAPRADAFRCCLSWHPSNPPTLFIGWGNFVKVAVIRERSALLSSSSSSPSSDGGGFFKATSASSSSSSSSHQLPPRYAEITAMFQTDYYVSGIAPYDGNMLILAYDESSVDDEDDGAPAIPGRRKKAPRPELRIVTMQGDEISSDALPIRGFENFGPADYRLEYCPSSTCFIPPVSPLTPSSAAAAAAAAAPAYPNPDEKTYYIVSPQDVVVARPRDVDDHIQWLLEREKYGDALAAAEEVTRKAATASSSSIINPNNQLKRHRLIDIGEAYIGHLISCGRFPEAAALCPRILSTNSELWEKWIFAFVNANRLKDVVKYIPTKSPLLSETVYELVLNDFLRAADYNAFLEAIRAWPPTLYKIASVTAAVMERLKQLQQQSSSSSASASSSSSAAADSTTQNLLLQALADLYTLAGQYDKTLAILLRLKREGDEVFEFIKKHQLFEAVQNKVVLLMEHHREQAVDLFVNHMDRIPVERVVAQLSENQQNSRYLLHRYLHALFVKDPRAGSQFHAMQVELYAEYEPQLLLPFLQQSHHYPLEAAYAICSQRSDLVPETVFLLGRMGNTKEALTLIIDQLRDIRKAVDFVEQQNDEELWDVLIERSLKSADFVSDLLTYIGAHVDPIKLIEKIPDNMKIPGLRDKLVKIISDFTMQMTLQEGCREVLKTDCAALSRRLAALQRRGVRCDARSRCAVCSQPIVAFAGAGRSALLAATVAAREREAAVVFFCSHVYHATCYQSSSSDSSVSTPAPSSSKGGSSSSSDSSSASGNSYNSGDHCLICSAGKKQQQAPTPAKSAAPASRR